jgi:hypothetical protein
VRLENHQCVGSMGSLELAGNDGLGTLALGCSGELRLASGKVKAKTAMTDSQQTARLV